MPIGLAHFYRCTVRFFEALVCGTKCPPEADAHRHRTKPWPSHLRLRFAPREDPFLTKKRKGSRHCHFHRSLGRTRTAGKLPPLQGKQEDDDNGNVRCSVKLDKDQGPKWWTESERRRRGRRKRGQRSGSKRSSTPRAIPICTGSRRLHLSQFSPKVSTSGASHRRRSADPPALPKRATGVQLFRRSLDKEVVSPTAERV